MHFGSLKFKKEKKGTGLIYPVEEDWVGEMQVQHRVVAGQIDCSVIRTKAKHLRNIVTRTN